MDEWSGRAIHRLTVERDAADMFQRRRLQLLDRYEVIGQPQVHGGLTYVPWVQQAVRPYVATRIPTGTQTGLAPLAPALRAMVTPELTLA
jgi:hypothetical protein